jgi:hypothetical protein
MGETMLTKGNHKLGRRLIWGFGLPSARPEICTGLSSLCRQHCYARRLEELLPALLARYQLNYQLSLLPSFVRRVCAFLARRRVAVARLHVGGDFYAAQYARKWLRIMRRMPEVHFYFYTRAWRDEAIFPVLERMAALPNCRAWFSCDRDTDVPPVIPPRVRLAWLAVAEDDLPPASVHLTFRIRRLRRQPASHLNGVRVCPTEDGVPRSKPVTCERCRLCWQPLPEPSQRRTGLPVVPQEGP